MRSCSRGSTDGERGIVLVSVLVLALLYFGLMSLLLIESTTMFRNASRFRSRVKSQVLAENAAELAARDMITSGSTSSSATNADGTMEWSLQRMDETNFRIRGTGRSSGPQATTASVELQGRISGNTVTIDRSVHSQ